MFWGDSVPPDPPVWPWLDGPPDPRCCYADFTFPPEVRLAGHPHGVPASAERASGPSFMRSVDFAQAPFLVIWETTQSCALVCRHCRASAQPGRDPRELTTEEGCRVIDEVAELGTPIMILSGGDPVNRPDLLDLIRHGKSRGLRMATIPAATDCLTRELVQSLKAAGLDQMAVSIDFPRAELHDGFRGVPGAFAKTMQAVAWAHEAGLPLQVNTTVCGDTAPYLEEMAEFVQKLGIVFWEVFFLVPMGRGSVLTGLSRLGVRAPLRGHLPRAEEGGLHRQGDRGPALPPPRGPARDEGGRRARRGPTGSRRCPRGSRSPRGPATRSASRRAASTRATASSSSRITGEIMPSGFLPIPVGTVRETSLAQAYREAPLFRQLRTPSLLKGRCGRCEFRDICGGSRSRAYGLTGDPFETDPWCSYEPLAKS